MTLDEVIRHASVSGLSVVGSFRPGPDDMAPTGARVLCLLGPDGPAMWQVFRESPEHLDGGAHPLDRWSHRVIEALAGTMGATALFPFGGPPWQPFQRWAARGEGAVQSPVGLQVTGRRGLWASYRGALAFFEDFDIPEPEDSQPCLDCPAPCLSACPIGAFADGRYDVASCVDFTDHAAGTACRSGCRARVSCPHGTGLNLPEAQREFHMTAFRNANRV